MSTTDTITLSYAESARILDAEIGNSYANWFHFAAWGTHTVGDVIDKMASTPTAVALARAERRIFFNVMAERPLKVREGLNWYRLAREDPDSAKMFINFGTTTIATWEQHLIDADIYEAFDAAPLSASEITRAMSVRFPTTELFFSQDVPGRLGTAVEDWRDFDQRMRWIKAVIDVYQADPTLHWSPFHVSPQGASR